MASNKLPEQTKILDSDFILKKIGKFWIMKAHNKTKRLTFLDNATDVLIDENILIADNKLFEIHKEKDGEFSFRKIDDLSCGSDCDRKEAEIEKQKTHQDKIDDTGISADAPLANSQKQCKVLLAKTEGTESEKEKAVCNVKYEKVTTCKNESEILDLQNVCSSTATDNGFSHGSDIPDVYLGSTDDSEYEDKVREEHDTFAIAKTEEDSLDKITQKTAKLFSNPEDLGQIFEVKVGPTSLARLCGIEGKMLLSIGTNDLVFQDPNTKSTVYSFHLPWIRRFGKDYPKCFYFEVGRKCSNGPGEVYCKTPFAEKVYNMCHEVCNMRAANTRRQSCKSLPDH